MNQSNKTVDIRELVGKTFQFAYPDKKGKTVMYTFTLMANKEDAEKFDKFWNMLLSLCEMNDIKSIDIYEHK